MKLETDLNEIKKLAEEKEDENWNFRTFLKGYDAPIEEIDAMVHRLNRQVSAEIDCKKCANCCKQISPLFNQNDIKRFVRGLALRAAELKSSFLQEDEQIGKYIFKVHPCPFLKDNLCTNYENRPADCASFPHLHKKDFVFRTIGIINNCSICPIIYNVLELLKQEIGFFDYFENDDDFGEFDDFDYFDDFDF